MSEAYIVEPVRSAVGKAYRGAFSHKRPDALCADVIKGMLGRVPDFDKQLIEDVYIGCAMPEGEQGMNVARFAVLLAGLGESVPAVTVNRFCSSGVQTIAMAADRVRSGDADCILAGGTESMTMVPMGGHKIAPSKEIMDTHPDYYDGMGITAENVAMDYKVSREKQDEFAFNSHQKAVNAIESGWFKNEIVPISVTKKMWNAKMEIQTKEFSHAVDEGPRADTRPELLAKLPAVFKTKGTVTAGNSSQMSDGAAACLVVSERFMKQHNLKPMARFAGYSVAGVPPRVMGIGPVEAIPRVLKKLDLKLEDIDRVELNEAFAAQACAVIDSLKVNPDIVNPTGGAIALGHPLGATGAKLTATLLHGMQRDKQKWGLVTMCIGTGMGACAAFENLAN